MEHEFSERERFLLRRALSPARSSAALMARAKAIEQLSMSGTPVPLDRVAQALEDIVAMDGELMTYQSGQAAAKALRLLDQVRGEDLTEYPSDTPDELAPDEYWPFGQGHPQDGDPFGWQDFHRGESQGWRDEWRRRVEGSPPWRRRSSAEPVPEPAGPQATPAYQEKVERAGEHNMDVLDRWRGKQQGV